MADIYVRSTDGSDADNGSTWALAKASLDNVDGASSADAAGDRILVSDNHSESTAAALTVALAGTSVAPTQVLCVDDAGDPQPPTSLAQTAVVATTGANSISITGHSYVHGITFRPGDSTNSASFSCGAFGERQIYRNCNFELNGNNTGGRINLGGAANSVTTEFWNCGYKFAHADQRITLNGITLIRGGSVLSGGTSPTSGVFRHNFNNGFAIIDGFDLSNCAAGVHVLDSSGGGGKVTLRNCKMPSGWSGNLFNALPGTPNCRGELWNCDAGDTNYRMWIEDRMGRARDEIGRVRTGGATDGDTPLSWQVITTTHSVYPTGTFRLPEIVKRVNTIGSSLTVTVEILHDSLTALRDDEIWVEAQFLGNSGFSLSNSVSDEKSNVLSAGASQAASTAVWDTTGMTNPNTQKLEVTFTPQEKGTVILTVVVAKASYTLYVCPKPTIA